MYLKKIVPFILLAAFLAPLSAGAFWPWNKNKTEQRVKIDNPVVIETGLSESGKIFADAKYRLFEKGFEKKDVEAVIANQSSLWFTSNEIMYLFEKQSASAKKPLLKNLAFNIKEETLNISADFQKIIKGKLSFTAKLKTEGAHLRVDVEKARLYNMPVPSSWVSRSFNRELDAYLKFLYQDPRYQGAEITIKNDIVKINFKFK